MNSRLIPRGAALYGVIAAICAAAIACGVSGSTPTAEVATQTPLPPPSDTPAPTNTPLPTNTPAPTSTPAPTDIPAEDLVSLVYQNHSNDTLCGVYLVPSEREDWGADMTGGRQIAAGGSHEVSGIPPGTYDILAYTCDGYVISWQLGAELPPGASATFNIETPSDFLTLTNNSSLSICAFYAIPVGVGDYSRNLLAEGQSIDPNHQFLIALNPGDWNVRIESCQGDVMEDVFTVDGNTPFNVSD